ncbi:fatty acid oxidation complex subunit alpha FadB [Parashewanella curva]|uniref:enoyl-CoA hydratase n=1 Tax=Parashewanella curva TaxID=2338552 RepID=A0A3L8Q250_9GAMM|nr:fatty acid oxidation complex subunit alpha FadB [Parashewanella curva]RLV60813.1 fatty acid oxidation complex subunit alpha FadB [Parashewanella curva]
MIYQSPTIQVDMLNNKFAHLCFNSEHSVNKLDSITLESLNQALDAVINSKPKALLLTSAKSAFIVGADITEFLGLFQQSDESLFNWLVKANKVFNKLEDLPFPTLSAINGFVLGGGFETVLATDFRIAEPSARLGLPETKLGLIPGFGGTVRLPRLIGVDNALEWITTGKPHKPDAAMQVGAIDAIIEPEQLQQAGIKMLNDAIDGKLDWQSRRQQKQTQMPLPAMESLMAFSTAKAMVFQIAGKHYPAPNTAVSVIEQSHTQNRQEALIAEHHAFVQMARTEAATALIGIFLNEQVVKHKSKQAAKSIGSPVQQAAVLGAGIMGGGISYQSASKGIPVTMKDINQAALDLGLSEAAKLLNNQVSRGRLTTEKMAKVLNQISATLDYASISHADIVVEAVVENPKVKAQVLAEVESNVNIETIIASNTSTISIDSLAANLKHPERFCGMHFFNPVHKMPLVEVIRGKATSDATIAKVVAYANAMGKTAIVVNDCPGFFVNRVLFPYFAGFNQLLIDGADFIEIDKVMEKVFGWPMGPAYLLDVVGIDTAHHAQTVMAQGFPERMPSPPKDVIKQLLDAKRLGQKNGLGFYQYQPDKKGKPKKSIDETIVSLLASVCQSQNSFDKDTIIARLMIPMIIETVRCLDEGIIASPAEADMALLYGLGFPPFRGGVFRYLDTVGLNAFIEQADKLAHLGPLYQVTDSLRTLAANNGRYFPISE